MSSLRMVIFCNSLLILLSACGPIYSTKYRFIPPQDVWSRQCITECLRINDNCYTQAENRAAKERMQCEQAASIRYATCIATAKTEAASKNCSQHSFCNQTADTSRCDSEYRHCYQNCGGIVEAYQVCEFGCN